MYRYRLLGALAVSTLLLLALPPVVRAENWIEIEPGLELGRFRSTPDEPSRRPDITIVRIDPTRWTLRLLAARQLPETKRRSVRMWCEEFDLTAAVNAGMYQSDFLSSVGYMQNKGQVLNPSWNKYRSLAAFDPLREDLPPFRIFDLDETDPATIRAQYGTLIQNLRLVKRTGENRWSQSERRWAEAALAEDGQGRALFVFCTTELPMFELIETLLDLPLDLVCAQHLEGGSEAQLYLNHPQFRSDIRGGDGRLLSWPVPNVIGIVSSETSRDGRSADIPGPTPARDDR